MECRKTSAGRRGDYKNLSLKHHEKPVREPNVVSRAEPDPIRALTEEPGIPRRAECPGTSVDYGQVFVSLQRLPTMSITCSLSLPPMNPCVSPSGWAASRK